MMVEAIIENYLAKANLAEAVTELINSNLNPAPDLEVKVHLIKNWSCIFRVINQYLMGALMYVYCLRSKKHYYY